MPPATSNLTEQLQKLWSRLNANPSAARPRKAAPNWVILQWEARGLTIAEGSTAGRGSLRHLLQFDWPAAAQPGDSAISAGTFLKEKLSSRSIGTVQTAVVIPREMAVVRRLDVPNVPDEELPEIVKFQAASRTSTPIERLALDFVPLATGDGAMRSVLVFTIEGTLLKQIQDVTRAAGLELAQLGLLPVATGEVVLRAAPPAASGPAIVVWQSENTVELSLVARERLAFSHDIHLISAEGDAHLRPLQTELTRAMVAMSQGQTGETLDQAYFITGREPDAGVRGLLEKRFGAGLHPVDVSQAIQVDELRPDDRLLISQAAPAIGQLLCNSEPRLSTIDFLNPRKRILPPDRRKERLRLAVGGGVLAVAFGLWFRQSSLTAKEGEIQSLTDENTRFDDQIKKNAPTVEASQKLSEWQGTDPRTLTSLVNIAPLVPGTDRVYFTDLKVETPARGFDAKLSADAVGRTEGDINGMLSRLAEGIYEIDPQSSAASKDLDYPRTYPLKIDQRSPAKPPVKRPAPPPTPPPVDSQ
jgi:hypothetical protein